MQSVYRKSTQKLFADQSLSLRSLYPLYSSGCGFDQNRFYLANATVKGSGHLSRKGTGGRSSVSGIAATGFGATGFLGRYVVQKLAKMGTQVLVPFRGSDDSHRHLKSMGDLGQIVPMKYDPRNVNSIKAVMAKGREYETRNFSFEEVNHGMAKPLAVEVGKMTKTRAKPITSFSPLEATVSVKRRISGLGNESQKIKRMELVDKITYALIPALILTSKGSLTTSILVLSVYWQVYGFFKEIFLDYVHQEVTRKWVLIYFQILLLILAKDTLLNFGLV